MEQFNSNTSAKTTAVEAQHHRNSLRLARRIVIKVGTPAITHCDGNLALARIGSLVEQIARLRQEGRDVMIVTSGAISTGALRIRKAMALKTSLADAIHQRQDPFQVDDSAAAAVGQALLMNMYETLFAKYNLSCAQVLITEDDINAPETMAQVTDTTMELMQLGTVPIVNDNDAVTQRTTAVYNEQTGEVIWDNDVLASRLAAAVRADLLIMLTDLDALYAAPSTGGDEFTEPVRLAVFNPEAKLVRSGINSGLLMLSDNGRGSFAGRTRMAADGMQSLVDASVAATANGVRAAVVTTGHHPLSILHIVRGDDIGTLFIAQGANPPTASKL